MGGGDLPTFMLICRLDQDYILRLLYTAVVFFSIVATSKYKHVNIPALKSVVWLQPFAAISPLLG